VSARGRYVTFFVIASSVALSSSSGCKRKPALRGPDASAETPTARIVDAPTKRAAAPSDSTTWVGRFARACHGIKERNRAGWADARCGSERAYDTCVEANGAGWAISVENAKLIETPSEPTSVNTYCRFTWKLTLYEESKNPTPARPDGAEVALVASDSKSFPGWSAYMEWGLSRLLPAGGASVFLEIVETDPYCATGCAPFEWTTHPHTGRVYIARNHEIVTRPDLGERDVEDVKDVDRDGRLDFVLAGPFQVRHTAIAWDWKNRAFTSKGTPQLLAHVLEDGSLSFDDATVRSFVRTQCPEKPPTKGPVAEIKRPRADAGLAVEQGADPDTPSVANAFDALDAWMPCAKFWGETTEQATATLDAAKCTSFVDTFDLETDAKAPAKLAAGVCPKHLSEWARLAVPFVLRQTESAAK
jgi:hypothetical protein